MKCVKELQKNIQTTYRGVWCYFASVVRSRGGVIVFQQQRCKQHVCEKFERWSGQTINNCTKYENKIQVNKYCTYAIKEK